MADVYEKNLAQKSSLTTSDFIRVVGSDNVSYKQLVSGVMTAMGLDAIKTPASEVSNIDTATSTGFYKYGSGASGTKPNSSGGVLIVVAFNASYSQQVAIPYDTNNSSGVYKRVVYSGTPTAWQLQPTRAEVDALKNQIGIANIKIIGIAGNASGHYDLANATRGITFFSGVTAAGRGIYAWATASNGTVSGGWLVQATGISVDIGTANVITFTNTSGAYVNAISIN